jgi:transposase
MAAGCPLRGGPATRSSAAGRADVRSGDRAGAGGPVAAGQHQVGVPVAAALASWWRVRAGVQGPGGAACRLSGWQLARLRAALDAGPAVYGWDEDQRWTLARVTTLIARLFHVRYTLRGKSYLLHRLGFSPQVPVHRAAERDEAAIAASRTGTWAKVRG